MSLPIKICMPPYIDGCYPLVMVVVARALTRSLNNYLRLRDNAASCRSDDGGDAGESWS
jgi:hypothetical protein